MVKTYKGCFAAVFIFIDFLVLLLQSAKKFVVSQKLNSGFYALHKKA